MPTVARVAFLTHSPDDPPGLLGRRSAELGLDVAVHRADRLGDPLPRPDSFDLLVVMGSAASTLDSSVPWIGRERRLVAAAVDAGTPVLGVCFGGQLLAQVLGAPVERAPRTEVGWHRVDTVDPARVPPGPWMMWHEDRFSVPTGAVEVARTGVCVQAYILGPHTGVQFHPEVDAGIVGRWVDEARADGTLDRVGGDAVLAGFDAAGRGPDDQTRTLFDGFVTRSGLLP